MAPQTPPRSSRPGEAVALLDLLRAHHLSALTSQTSQGHG
jgi:hypothetical protein